MGRVRSIMAASILGVIMPGVVYAQASIAGVAKDPSGAVVPGVTVEVASPALIEKVRTTNTDGAGAYRVTELPPGAYSVTFTLMGFNTYKRDGIELSGNFTAQVDAQMKVGAVEETVTVTGETPIVDVQTSQQQRVMDKDVIRDIPTSRQYYSVVTLIPGITMTSQTIDVGGSNPTATADFVMHGGRQGDGRLYVDGISVGQRGGGGGANENGADRSMFLLNLGAVQETSVLTSGGLGESPTSGVAVNLLPRDGGNTHRGGFYTNFANGSFQGNNYTAALAAQGLRTPNQLDKVWEATVQEGGPLVKDRLWYYATARDQGTRNLIAGMYYNLNAGDVNAWSYAPDLNRRANTDDTWRTVSLRLTNQISNKDKLNLYWEEQDRKTNFLGGGNPTTSPDASANTISNPDRAYSATWTRPQTNRLLFEAGAGGTRLQWGAHERPGYNHNLIQVTDIGANAFVPGIVYRGMTWANNQIRNTQARASASYVSGTHTAKVGYQGFFVRYDDRDMNPNPIAYQFSNGVPTQLTLSAAPLQRLAHINQTSIYAQDSWRLSQLTVQWGVRYDHIHSVFPEQIIGPVKYLPTVFDFPETEGASVHDLTPRVAATYDLRGDGKTALKFSLGKYLVAGEEGTQGEGENPVLRIARSTTRAWSDITFPVGDPRRGNFVPDCDLLNPAKNGECGAYATQSFGTQAFTSVFDPDLRTGWGKRAYNWEFSASVQHQVLPRLGMEVGYFRRWFGNQVVTENLAFDGRLGCGTPTDHSGCFDSFTYTVPVDPRLPGGGGYALAGFQNVKPAVFGQTNNFNTSVENFGGKTEYWQGVDINANVRAVRGVTVQGGTSFGRMTVDACTLAARLPETFQTGQTLLFDPVFGTVQTAASQCRVQQPWLPQFKGFAAYVVPKLDVLVSTAWQSIQGPQVAANFNAPTATILPLLNRNLSGNAATTPLNLVPSGTLYGDRINLLDMRFAKVLRYRRTRTNVGVDLYNIFNSNKGTTYNQTYGGPTANYLTPTAIVAARFVKLNVQFDF